MATSFGLQALLVAAACAFAYGNTLGCDFIWDDVPAVRENEMLRDPAGIPRLFRTRYWNADAVVANYRPLLMTTFALDRWMFGPDAAGFHFMNLVWHGAACLALLLLFRRILGPGWPAAAGALLFAVHPVHVESVTSLVGRGELMATLFTVLSLVAYERAREETAPARCAAALLASAACLGLGLLCKESAVVTLGLCVLFEWRRVHARGGLPRRGFATAGIALAAQLLVAGAFLVVRQNVLGRFGDSTALFVVEGTGLSARVAVMGTILADYLRMLVLPVGLSASYAINSQPARWIAAAADPAAWAAGALVLACAAASLVLLARGRPTPFAIGIAWFFITLSPTSNLIVPIGVLKAERFLYLPSAGAVLFLGAWLVAFADRLRAPERSEAARVAGAALLPAVLLLFAGWTAIRNLDWTSSEVFWQAQVERQPDDPVGHVGLGFVRYEQGKAAQALGMTEDARELLTGAVDHFQRSASLDPRRAGSCLFLAEALSALGRHAEALAALDEAVARLPDAGPLTARGFERLLTGDHAEARRDFERALELDPAGARAMNGLSSLEAEAGRWPEAETWARRALAARPGSSSAMYNLGRALVGGARHGEAIDHLDRMLQVEPDHAGALHLRGIARLAHGRGSPEAAREAARDLRAALRQDPRIDPAYPALVEALRACGEVAEAAEVEARMRARGIPLPDGPGAKH